METSLKTIGMLVVLTIILSTSFNLINTFNQYTDVKLLASDLENLGDVMKTLKDVSGEGSWRYVNIKVPNNYTLYFNNETDLLEVRGAENFNIIVNNDLIYGLNISQGDHQVQLYHGLIAYEDLKNETVVFQ